VLVTFIACHHSNDTIGLVSWYRTVGNQQCFSRHDSIWEPNVELGNFGRCERFVYFRNCFNIWYDLVYAGKAGKVRVLWFSYFVRM
jgi:hypothetical protein